MSYPQAPGVSRHTMERMSDNTSQRKALQQLESESDYDRITYYQKSFMVLWAAVQEASSELQDDYALSPRTGAVVGCRADPQGVGLAGGPSCGNGFGARRVEIECGARGRGKSRQRVAALSSAQDRWTARAHADRRRA